MNLLDEESQLRPVLTLTVVRPFLMCVVQIFAFEEPCFAIELREIAGRWNGDLTSENIAISEDGDVMDSRYGQGRISIATEYAANIVVTYQNNEKCWYYATLIDPRHLRLADRAGRSSSEHCQSGQFTRIRVEPVDQSHAGTEGQEPLDLCELASRLVFEKAAFFRSERVQLTGKDDNVEYWSTEVRPVGAENCHFAYFGSDAYTLICRSAEGRVRSVAAEAFQSLTGRIPDCISSLSGRDLNTYRSPMSYEHDQSTEGASYYFKRDAWLFMISPRLRHSLKTNTFSFSLSLGAQLSK